MFTSSDFSSADFYFWYLALTGTKDATSADFKNKDIYQVYTAI